MSTALAAATKPFTIALVDDYDVVLLGLAHMFDDYNDKVVVAEIDANAPLEESIDVVLYDAFAQPESRHAQIGELVKNPRARHVVVYTWNFYLALIHSARAQGCPRLPLEDSPGSGTGRRPRSRAFGEHRGE